MQKLFDELLASRMKVVFDSHQEEYNPDDWKNMRAKLDKKSGKRMLIIFPVIAKAASIILFIGLSVFYVNQNLKNNHKNESQLSTINNENNIESNTINKHNIENQNIIVEKQYKANEDIQILPNNHENKLNPNNNRDKAELSELNKQNIEMLIFPLDSSKLILANIKTVLQNHRNNIQKMANKPINNSNEKKLPEITENKDLEIIKKKEKQFEFGVELASVSNYSTNANGSSLNVGGGFSAGYKISKNISIASGLTVSKQSLDYKNSENLYALRSDMEFADKNSINIIDRNTVESNIDFIAIDIPLNLRYRIKKIILSAGISSLFFINEKYSYNYDVSIKNMTYNNQTLSYESQNSTQNISSEQSSESFNHFDFAGLFNFSVAYDMPLQKGSLAFEPYVKLPLADISSHNVKMGSGGLTVRYNF